MTVTLPRGIYLQAARPKHPPRSNQLLLSIGVDLCATQLLGRTPPIRTTSSIGVYLCAKRVKDKVRASQTRPLRISALGKLIATMKLTIRSERKMKK